MFLYDPAARPSASDVLEHPYFTSEEPAPKRPEELQYLEGDWHEFESKALRREKERVEKEERRRAREEEKSKRKLEGAEADEAAAAAPGPDAKKSRFNEAGSESV